MFRRSVTAIRHFFTTYIPYVWNSLTAIVLFIITWILYVWRFEMLKKIIYTLILVVVWWSLQGLYAMDFVVYRDPTVAIPDWMTMPVIGSLMEIINSVLTRYPDRLMRLIEVFTVAAIISFIFKR